MIKAKQIGKIEEGEVYEVSAPLDKQILAFEEVGIGFPFLVTSEQACDIRLDGVSKGGTRTSMMPIAVKREKPLLYRQSPFMNAEMAKIAVASHVDNKYPNLPREFYEAVKERAKRELSLAPEDRTVHTLQNSEDYDLTPEMDDTKFILGKPTIPYFKKFNLSSIPLYNLPTDGLSKDECRANYLWFPSVDDGSDLNLRDRDLDYYDRALGVLRKSAEGASQNFYKITNVQDAVRSAVPKLCEEIGITGLTDLLKEPIEKIILKTLREQQSF